MKNTYIPVRQPRTENQCRTVSRMVALGWQVTHRYSDGVLRMSRDSIFTYVREDGSCRHPVTWKTVISGISLRDARVPIRAN